MNVIELIELFRSLDIHDIKKVFIFTNEKGPGREVRPGSHPNTFVAFVFEIVYNTALDYQAPRGELF